MERPKRGWFGNGLKSDAVLPPVGPAFITMDDAARYAHQQIGKRRDVEYGGVILESLSDGYFYATEPIPGERNSFDTWKVLKVDSDGQYLHPPGYRCVADYHSHPDMFDEFKANYPEFSERQVRGLNGFFSDIDLSINILERGFFSASYLSGPDGGLLKHVTTGSAEEQRFGVWLDQKLAFGHADGPTDNKPESLFQKTASVSQLSIVVPSTLWGGATGTVPRQWRPFTAFVSRTYELPACGPVHAGLDAMLAVLQQRNPQRAFILKDANKEDYVLVEPPAGGPVPVSIQQLFPRTPDGNRVSHESFYWVAVYLGRSPVPLRLAPKEPWLYRNFFSPLELATQLYHGLLSRDLLGPERRLFFYRDLNDGALLQYQCAFSTAEAELFRVEPDGQVVDNQIDSALLAGTLLPRDFVLRVAVGGYLSVIRTGKIWDKLGPVDAQWRAISRVPMPVLSPPFVTADDAARWAHNRIGDRRERAYGGAVLQQDARYFATEPLAAASIQFDFRAIMATDEHDAFVAPAPFSCYAFYHSYPAGSPGEQGSQTDLSADQAVISISFFSSTDQAFIIGNRAFAPAHYLSGPQDSLLKYVSSGSTTEQTLLKQLTGELESKTSTEFEGAIWNFADAGDLRVVLPSRVWGGVRGRVARGWRVGNPVIPTGTVQEQPFFTPQASMGQVVALIALNDINGMPAGAYQGFVLKHQSAPSYIATLPVAAGTTLASLFPARSDGQPELLSNYRLVGVYRNVFASEPRQLPANEAWLYKRFAPPAVWVEAMTLALATFRQQIAGLGLKLYLQTADQALLHWQVPSVDSSNELFTVAGQVVIDKGNQAALLDGSLTPRAFVRRVIRAGELSVLQQSGLWNVLGPMHDRELLPLGSGPTSLSAAFLTADDAARHAHERIGFRRSSAYGGYILKRADGRFVFTEPVVIHGDGFVSDLLRPVPGGGLLVPAAGYELYARYASRGALSLSDLERHRRLDWSFADLEVNATMFSDVEIRSVIESGLPVYLSGSLNNLIGYTPSGSANELLVLNNTTREPGQHGYFERLETGRLKPVDIVSRLADAGNLQVLVHSPLWGPRGRVYDDWTPNFEYASVDLQTPAFSAIFNQPDAAAINAHVRGHGQNLDAQGYTAYLLKHPQKSEYIVSELAPAESGSWLSDSSLGAGYLAGGDFAHGFVVVGLLYSQQWLPSGLPTTQAWLTQFFATPSLLQRAEKDARYLLRSGAVGVLPVYLSTLEGALLRFQPPGISLFTGGENGEEVSVQGMRLSNGTLDIRRFVSLMAQTGGLTVLYSSPCWDRRGALSKLPSQWRPYEHLLRRRLGPVFYDQDDAARYARSRLKGMNGGLSGGLILKRPDGLFVATEPVRVPREDFDPKWVFPDEIVGVGGFPAAHTIVARYRSSPGRELPFALDATQRDIYRNMLSTRVIGAALSASDTHLNREYLFGADGSVLSYSRSGSALEAHLKVDLQPLNLVRADRLENTLEHQIRSGALKPEAFVVRLSKAGTLRVVEGSKVWGGPRRLLGFQANADIPYAMQIQNALAEPAFSPVFAQEQDAVRYAHERCQYDDMLKFGYVFKSTRKEQYMVTLPLTRLSYWKYEQVFPYGLFPQGYLLVGIYLCASLETLTPAPDPHQQTFLAPMDMDNGLRFSRRAVQSKTLRLYLSCPDGALIRYLPLDTEEVLDSRAHFPAIRQQLYEGKITLLDYVHDLARHGNLDVLVEGKVWAGTNRITPGWVPGTGEGFSDYPMGCGPLFSHSDDAARDVQRGFTTAKGHNYVTAILADPAHASFIATLPVWPGIDTPRLLRLFYTGRSGPVQPAVQPTDKPVPWPDFPNDYRVVGAQLIYKDTPPASQSVANDERLASHFIEPTLLSYFIRILKAHSQASTSLYLVTRGGALLKYIPGLSLLESQLMVSAARLKPIEFFNRLTGVGQLFVLDRDDYWRHEGVIKTLQAGSRKGVQTDEPLQIRDRDEL
ncbi:DUF4329 domain-containing protein [Pseudomonas brenneri]|uniref:DUF4329 domain-containing protein n=1 Tax=Pseudomonas brenneri TaxID=129817 RepID=UPI003B9E62A7